MDDISIKCLIKDGKVFIKTGSFISTTKGNHFYTSDQTIYAQLSSSAAAKRFKDDTGTLKVSILYSKVL